MAVWHAPARLFSIVLLTMTLWCCACQPSAAITPAQREAAVQVLRRALLSGSAEVRLRAAEHLVALRYDGGADRVLQRERCQLMERPQYRIGAWRALAKAADRDAQRAAWLAEIRSVALDAEAADRWQAAEALVRLGYVVPPSDLDRFRAAAQSADEPLAAMLCGLLVQSGCRQYESTLIDLLAAAAAETRRGAAWALHLVEPISATSCARLRNAALREPRLSAARTALVGAALVHACSPPDALRWHQELAESARDGPAPKQAQTLALLARLGNPSDLPLLAGLLRNPTAAVRVDAAYCMLRIGRRTGHHLRLLDWAVIAAYATGMIAVGWYYSRRTATTEDYLLGSRQMRPLTVGLSMFATLLSTLSYLAIPGEMIKHGPIIASQYLVYPLNFIVIGFLLIPFIMRLRATSAYEILEVRLDLRVRLFGSSLFLALRFLWMALIIYATSSKVLVPMLQWDESTVPYVCAVMGLITVVYTTMGGIRAVVMTDVAQTVILFGGAVLTLALITIRMGGVGAWWPTGWSKDWDPLILAFDPEARLTVAGAMTSCFIWYVCTAGSDQVAIQRYFATRDTATARRVLLTSLCADVTVGVLLAVLGLALWSYFSANPAMLPDGYGTAADADMLFPRFIMIGLPTGISGLVIAGLLAAAMSSLSSGVNSSSSVIAVDFVDRFRTPGRARPPHGPLQRVRLISVFVGVAVIVLSIVVGHVSGNLLAVVYRVANLLVAPLFVLFFMALFVPWATPVGTIFGGLCSVVMAVGIAFGEWFGLSFIWIMPLALLTGIVTGPIASLLLPTAWRQPR